MSRAAGYGCRHRAPTPLAAVRQTGGVSSGPNSSLDEALPRHDRTPLRLAAGVTARALALGLRHGAVGGTRGAARIFAPGSTVSWHGRRATARRPLVLVGGYASIPELYSLLARSYRAAGIADVRVAPLIDHAFGDIEENAQVLARFLELVPSPCDLVGHSEGGLICRAYINLHGGLDRVAHLVTLGTPHGGLPVADHVQAVISRAPSGSRIAAAWQARLAPLLSGLSTGALQQMMRGSEFLRALDAAGPTPAPTRYLAIGSRHDGLCPFSGAFLPDDHNVANVAIDDGWVRGNHLSIASTNERCFAATMMFVDRPHDLDVA